jgi:hypothetical protein
MAAIRAVAVSAPMPGISKSRRVVSSWCAISMNSAADPLVQPAPFLPQVLQQATNTRAQPILLIGEQLRQSTHHLSLALRQKDAALQKDAADLVDQCRAAIDQPLADAMQRLQVQLRFRLRLGPSVRISSPLRSSGIVPPPRAGHRHRFSEADRRQFLAEAAAAVAALLETAKLNGVEPHASLKDVLERMANGLPSPGHNGIGETLR